MREIISITLVIIGALVGAGFASGQEIFSFFCLYGLYGVFGIILMCILMYILIYKTLKIIYLNKIDNYNEFLKLFLKENKANKIINIIINILLLFSFFIMVAGFGAYFEQELGINRLFGSFLFSFLCAIVFFLDIKGILKISNIVVPLLIIFIIFIGIKNILNIQDIKLIRTKNNWIMSSILYTSYNLILLIPVLISLRKQISKELNIKYIAFFSSIIINILAVLIFVLMAEWNLIDLEKQEMPAIYIVRNKFFEFRNMYAFIILASIFTTAISVGIGFLQNISKNKKSYTQYVIIMCITSLFITKIGFSKVMNFIYPVFGYFGIMQIVLILIRKLKNDIAK